MPITDLARRWLTTEDLAARAKVSVETVRYWRKQGRGPKAHRLGGSVRYDLADITDWEDAGADGPKDEAPRTSTRGLWRSSAPT
jgi:predicted DNA-binding transcriptional regulator AlpA